LILLTVALARDAKMADSNRKQRESLDSGTAGALLFIVWLFVPFMLHLSTAEGGFFFQLRAITWVFNIWPNHPNQFSFFDPMHLLSGLFYGLFLMIYIIGIVRYLQFSFTRRKVLISAIISQSMILIDSIIFLTTRFPFKTGFMISLPVPFLLLGGWLMIKGINYSKPGTPWSKDESY
jgi:hypothetical protein